MNSRLTFYNKTESIVNRINNNYDNGLKPFNRLFIYITFIFLFTFNNNQFCQSKHGKIIHSKKNQPVVKQITVPVKKKLLKPKNESFLETKPIRAPHLSNPPERHRPENPPARKFKHHREIADNPVYILICKEKSVCYGYDYCGFMEDEKYEKDPFIIEEVTSENYYPIIQYLQGKEFTDKNFPLCIKNVEFNFLRRDWINFDDLPESMIDNSSGYYFIYKIKFDAYVFDLNYQYPFAALITYPDYSSDMIIFNYDLQNLQADSVYSFVEEVPLKQSGYAWLTLGYYDLEFEQFYSSALSPYITKRKVLIPYASN